jgi:hypothetical protein
MSIVSFTHKNLLLFICLVLNAVCLAQKDENRMDFSGFDVSYYRLPAPEQVFSLPVSTIEVHDIRFDTSYIGLLGTTVNNLHFIRLKQGFTEEIRKYYQSLVATDPHSQTVLHCFIRKLFLTDHIPVDNNEELRTMADRYDTDEKSGIFFVAEFYEQQDSIYRPLYRIDTLISDYKSIQREGQDYLERVLKASLVKAGQLNWTKYHEKAVRLSRHYIDSFNTARINIPAVTDTLKKGIYLTYEDFRQNKPSTREFTVSKSKKGDFLYVKNSRDEDVLFTDLWGYCDGKDRYIFSASNYFKLHRTGNGFTIFGAKEHTGKRRYRPSVAPNTGSGGGFYGGSTSVVKYYLVKSYFQLDMDTGKIY